MLGVAVSLGFVQSETLGMTTLRVAGDVVEIGVWG